MVSKFKTAQDFIDYLALPGLPFFYDATNPQGTENIQICELDKTQREMVKTLFHCREAPVNFQVMTLALLPLAVQDYMTNNKGVPGSTDTRRPESLYPVKIGRGSKFTTPEAVFEFLGNDCPRLYTIRTWEMVVHWDNFDNPNNVKALNDYYPYEQVVYATHEQRREIEAITRGDILVVWLKY